MFCMFTTANDCNVIVINWNKTGGYLMLRKTDLSAKIFEKIVFKILIMVEIFQYCFKDLLNFLSLKYTSKCPFLICVL